MIWVDEAVPQACVVKKIKTARPYEGYMANFSFLAIFSKHYTFALNEQIRSEANCNLIEPV